MLQEYDSYVTVLAQRVTFLWHRAGAWSVYALTPVNEANDPREWPVEGHQLTADHVVYLYNTIYRKVKDLLVKVGRGDKDERFCLD